MAPPTANLGDATTQVIALTFELAEHEIENFDTLLQNSLNQPQVREAISSALTTFISQRMASGASTSNMNGKDAADLVKALQSAAGAKAGDAVAQQIKNDPQYKKLEQAIKNFENAAKTSPMGVWVDKNQGVVVVVGLALVVGGAAALWVTKTSGATLDKGLDAIVNNQVQIFKIGKFSVSGQGLAFQPDTHTIGAALTATEKFQQVQISVKFGVVAAGSQVQKVDGAVVVKTGDATVTVTGTGTAGTPATATAPPTPKKVNLGLTFGVDKGSLSSFKFGAGAIITDGKLSGGSVNAGFDMKKHGKLGVTGQSDGREVKGIATWTITF